MDDSKWGKSIPWYLTIACTISLVLVAWYLYVNIEWYKALGTSNKTALNDGDYLEFFFLTYTDLLTRSLGMITGIAIAFLGLGVSFFQVSKSTDVNITGFAKLASASPGLIAICLGSYLIIKSLDSNINMKFAPAKEQQQPQKDQVSASKKDTSQKKEKPAIKKRQLKKGFKNLN